MTRFGSGEQRADGLWTEVYEKDPTLLSEPLTATLWHAEAAQTIARVKARGTAIRLAYIDPPFASARDYDLAVDLPSGESLRRVAYSDRWPDIDAYLAMLKPVLDGLHDILTDDGSVLVHCDHRASPAIAMYLDQLFGTGDRQIAHSPGFRNELIWRYGLGGSSNRCYPKKHDTVLWYSKSDRWVFHPPMVPATSAKMRGQMKKAPDVLDVPTINNMAVERTGYPTQKPLALLKMLVGAHSDPGDTVLDVFSGSGTTAAAAISLGRHAIAGDMGADAIATTRARLLGRCTLRIHRPAAPATLDIQYVTDRSHVRCDEALVHIACGVSTPTGWHAKSHWRPSSLRKLGQDYAEVPYDASDESQGPGAMQVLVRTADGREGFASCASRPASR